MARRALRWRPWPGVNIVEHCTWVSPEAGNKIAFDERIAEQMARQGTFIDPTLAPATLRPPQDPETLSPAQRETLEIDRTVLAAHRRCLELGVEIAAGTDAGVANTPTSALPLELTIYHEQLGLSPEQAITAATLNAARSIGLEREIGTLKPGRRADLLLVKGNPLDDLRRLREVEAVYKDGALEVEQGRSCALEPRLRALSRAQSRSRMTLKMGTGWVCPLTCMEPSSSTSTWSATCS